MIIEQQEFVEATTTEVLDDTRGEEKLDNEHAEHAEHAEHTGNENEIKKWKWKRSRGESRVVDEKLAPGIKTQVVLEI